MRRESICLFLILMVILMVGCSKEKEKNYSGINTIDNLLFGESVYYAIGFSFDRGELLPTHEQPEPDITVHAITDNSGLVTGAYLDTPILVPPFALAGELLTAEEAVTFYKNLIEVGSPSWLSTANPVKVNQVWIVRTPGGNYAKFRVIELVLENRAGNAYVEMKFEWKIQPDGSTSFSQ